MIDIILYYPYFSNNLILRRNIHKIQSDLKYIWPRYLLLSYIKKKI